jgi:hypothetical protein
MPMPPAAPPRAAARLRLTSATVSRRTRLLTVKGTIARGATGRVRLTVTIGRGAKARSRTFSAAIRRGRFIGKLRLSRSNARRQLRVVVRYRGSSAYGADSTGAGVRRRS